MAFIPEKKNNKPQEVTDHIKPIIDGGAKFDLSNLQSLCHRHHNRKRGKERAKKYESKTKTET